MSISPALNRPIALAQQPLVHDLAALRQPNGIADFLVEHGLARLLVPEGREEVEQVAAEQRAGVGGPQRGDILRASPGDALENGKTSCRVRVGMYGLISWVTSLIKK